MCLSLFKICDEVIEVQQTLNEHRREFCIYVGDIVCTVNVKVASSDEIIGLHTVEGGTKALGSAFRFENSAANGYAKTSLMRISGAKLFDVRCR